jgi:hypothetical protein
MIEKLEATLNTAASEERHSNSFELLTTGCHNQFWSFGEYELVGHGEVTNEYKCGTFLGFYGCLHIERHNVVTLDGHNHRGEVYVRKVRNFCDKPSCPVCYRHGWAVREAANIESRIKEASKKFGQAEHIIVSVPEADYGLTLESLRKKVIAILAARGVFGGCLIFHAFRYHKRDETFVGEVPRWFWSPHFHCIGFVDGGYSRCRRCKKNTSDCMLCDGFEGRTRRCYSKEGGRLGSGYIVKVKGKRKTIHGTAWYQLHHASIRRNSVRFHAATWFGTCSYRRLKLKKEDRIKRDVCPICRSDLVRLKYVGVGNALAEFLPREFWDKLLDEYELPKWVEAG